jgi:hypothetical protein
MLQWGAMLGVPMRPDEVQEPMHQMNQPKMAHVLPTDEDEGGDPHDDLWGIRGFFVLSCRRAPALARVTSGQAR